MDIKKCLGSKREEWLKIRKEYSEKALSELKKTGADRISCITGTDTGKAIEITYHLLRQGKSINLKISLPRENPQIRTITGIFPGAELFEREISEMLGIRVLGHPDPRRLFLPENWRGKPPYRK